MDEQRERPSRGAEGAKRNDGVLFTSSRRRGNDRRRRNLAIGGGLLLLLLVAGGAWFFLRSGGEPEPTVPAATTADTVAPAADTSTASADGEEIDLPELDASDERVREMAQRLSERPAWAEWLVTDDLVRRFVGSVVSVSAGASPADQLGFMAPDERFRVREAEDGLYVDPASYERYDLPTAVFVSLDTEGAAELYRRLQPLFEEAHQELGFAEGTFDDAVARAVENLLAVEVPEGPVAVEPGEALYEFRNPRLENRSEAEKHLLRLGPDNARRVQAKLRELSGALGLAPPGGS